jgi:UDPglucose 6-dehydrogenase
MNVAMIGAGRVGLVAAACLADFGFNVHCVDKMEDRIESLLKGNVPFEEPGLAELARKNRQAGRLHFSNDLTQAVRQSLVLFIAVGTEDEIPGKPNLKFLYEAAEQIAASMTEYKVLVIKSTVPVGTARALAAHLRGRTHVDFDIVSNPEFLREGSAIEGFMRPDRVVLGVVTPQALAIMRDIYRPLFLIETPIVVTDNNTAELSKYASNAFLATKISFINEIANFCDFVGVDVHDVSKVLGLDKRIGPKFLHPGPGWGGSCLPKDTRALIAMAREAGCKLPVVEGTCATNVMVIPYLLEKLEEALGPLAGKRIGVLGLTYKQFTDDLRESPAVEFTRQLLRSEAVVQAFDPAASGNAAAALKDPNFHLASDAYQAAANADGVAVLTEWNQFRNLDLGRLREVMNGDVLMDTRNCIAPDAAAAAGFHYVGRGRRAKTSRRETAAAAEARSASVPAGTTEGEDADCS